MEDCAILRSILHFVVVCVVLIASCPENQFIATQHYYCNSTLLPNIIMIIIEDTHNYLCFYEDIQQEKSI